MFAYVSPANRSFLSESPETVAVMVNGLFDLDIGVRWLFPYAGAGLGYASTHWRGVGAAGGASVGASVGASSLTASGTSGNLAYQAIAGLAFPVPHVPGLSATAEYRFLGVVGPERFAASLSRGGRVVSGGFDPKETQSHVLLVGLRFAFDVAAPPVAGASAPPPR